MMGTMKWENFTSDRVAGFKCKPGQQQTIYWDRPEYIAAKKSKWSELHLHDHIKTMQAGGKKRTRCNKLTAPGALASLATVRLVDLTSELMGGMGKG